MEDRANWERTRNRGHEGNREPMRRGQEDWRQADWERDPRYSTADERNRAWSNQSSEPEYRGRNGGDGYGESRPGYEGDRGRYGNGERRWTGSREYGSEQEDNGGYPSRDFEGACEGWDRGYEGPRQSYGGRESRYDYRRGDYGPGAFTRQFARGPEYFGSGQSGYGTTWGGANSGLGCSGGYTGGIGTYSEQGSYTGRGPKGYQRSDERIREDICERLTNHPEIDASEIEIQVKSGEVTLTGTVDRREAKRRAEDVAESVSGVKDVHNQLRAQPQGAGAEQGTHHGGSANRETATSKSR